MNTLNLKEAASYLHMHPVTLLQKANAGIVPAAKPAKRWVFIQSDLDNYIRGLYKSHSQFNESPTSIDLNITTQSHSKLNYYKSLGLSDCPQIHSPKLDSRSGVSHAQVANQVAKGKAVGLVVNSVNMSKLNCG